MDTDVPAHTATDPNDAHREHWLAFATRRNANGSEARPSKAASFGQIELLTDSHVCEMER